VSRPGEIAQLFWVIRNESDVKWPKTNNYLTNICHDDAQVP